MRTSRLLRGLSILCLVICATSGFSQTQPPFAVPLISQVTPASIPASSSPNLIVQFTLNIVGANFPANAVVKMTVPEGPSIAAASVTVNSAGTQINAFFNTTLPRAAVYTVTVSNPSNNPAEVSNAFYLPITPSASTVGITRTQSQALSGAQIAMASGDFNRDGNPDIAVVSQNPNVVSIFLGNFGGGLNAGASYPVGNTPSGIVAADFNGDGFLDLAITNAQDNTITILLGNGDGTFQQGTTVSDPGTYPTKIVAADLNGDGHLDLAVLNLCGPTPITCAPQAGPTGQGAVLVLLGNGDGTFSASPSSARTGQDSFFSAMAAADLNGDGAVDLLVANQFDNTVTLLMGNGDGTFRPGQSPIVTGQWPSGIAVGDFNGDGKLDFAVTNYWDGTVSVFLNQNCAGLFATACTFTQTAAVPVGTNPDAIAAGDMNADGFVDLVVTNFASNNITMLLGDGTGGFSDGGLPNPLNFGTDPQPFALTLADFSGDGRLDILTLNGAATYSLLTQTAVPQVLLSLSNAVPVYGQPMTYTAQVNPSFGAQPTGTVTFFDGSTSLGTASLYGYQANLFGSTPNVGTHQITATYNGDANFLASTSAAVTETVSQAQTSLTLSSNVNQLPFGQPFTLSATVVISNLGTPTGTVSFFDTSTSTSLGTATVTNGVAQLTLSNLTPGAHVITATYNGDFNFTGSTSPTYQENITQATTIVSLSVSPTQAQFAQAVTFTAAFPAQSGGAAAPTGTVSFYDGSTLLGTSAVANNSATFSTSALAIGLHSISAQYSGDVNFLSVSSGTVSLTITKAATTTTVSSSLAPSVYGQNVTFSATTTPAFGSLPAGQISFFDGTTLLGTVNATNGVGQLTLQSLTGGTHSITAEWLPTYNYAASTSNPLAQTVSPAASTLTLSTNINPSYYGQQILLNLSIDSTYHYASNGATVTVFDNGTSLGAFTFISGSSASFPISSFNAGTHVLTATYTGDSNLQGSSTTSGLTQTVNQASTSSSAFLTSYSTLYSASVTISGTLSSPSSLPETGTLSFYDGTTLLGTAPVSGARAQYTTSSLLPGTHPITVQYSGDANFLASASSPAQTLTVSKDPTLSSVSVDVNPSTYGQTVTLTAAVQLEFGSGATGSVSFLDGTTVLGSAPYANGGAKFTISTLGGGSHSITAQYSGDTYFASSTSTALTQTVNPAATSISVASGTSPSTFGQAVTLTATVQSLAGTTATGSVTFMDGSYGIGTGTLANNTAQLTLSSLAVGSHNISAVYGGNANLTGSTSSAITETITQAATTTAVTSNLNPASFGQCVQLSATVQPASGTTKATGTVSFLDGSTSIGTGTLANNVAALSYCGFAGGTHSITANYSGDSNYISSVSAALTETVSPVSSSVAVASNQNPATFGSVVTFTATVAPSVSGASATGSVTFFDGSTSLGTATVSSNSAQLNVSSVAVGSHSVTAKYGGDGNFNGSTSATLTEIVNAAPTTTTVLSSLNPASYGQSVILSASIQPPSGVSATGTVTFFDGSASVGTATVSSNAAQMAVSSLLAGTHSITAAYSGNSNLAGSTSSAVSEVVNPATTTTTISSSANPASVGQVVTFTVSVQSAFGGTAGGNVSFSDGTTLLGTVSLTNNSGQLSVSTLGAGSHSLAAAYNGDASTTASTSSVLSQTINPAATTTTFTASPNPSVFNQWISFVVTVAPATGGTPTGAVTLMDGTNTLSTATLSSGVGRISYSGLAPGTHSLTAGYSGDANFTASTSAAQNVKVNQASTTTTVSSSLNPSTYGQAVTFTASVQAPQGINPFGTVTFMDGSATLGSAGLSNGSAQLTLSGLAAGSRSITAAYGGNTYLTGSTSTALAQSVNADSSATTVSSSVNPAGFGQTVVLSATIQPAFGGGATGTVTFLDGAVALGSSPVSGNAAQLSLSSLAVGSHAITARYSGDGNVAGSTSAALTQTVSQAATTTTVTSGANPAVFEQSVTFSVRIQSSSNGTPTGTVTLMDGSGSLGSTALPANGVAQFAISSLVPGAHAMSASYSGDANFGGSTSAALAQTINQMSTTTTLVSSMNPAAVGQSVTFTATVQAGAGNSAAGTVSFMDGSSTLGTVTVANNSAQLTFSTFTAGTHSITAVYSGSTDFSGSTSAALTETVNQASTTTTLVSNLNPATFGQGVPLVATVQTASGGAATGTVTFYDGSSVLGIAGVQNNNSQHNVAQLTFAGFLGGVHTITAAYNGDANYTASTSSAMTETINPASSTVTVGSSSNPASFGQAVILTATVVPSVSGTFVTGTVTFFDGSSSLGAANVANYAAQISVANFGLGSHSITATYAGDRNFTGSTSAALAEVVNPAATSTVITSNANPAVVKSTVTFTATASSSSSGTQSGTVNFYLDGSSTAAASVNVSNGTANYSTNSLSAGSHSVVAVFTSSNPDFAGSTSPAFTQFVSDFTVAVSPSSLTVARSTSGTYILTVTPVGEFSGTLSLSCGGVPGGTTCAISPTQVTLSASGSAQATATITAAQNASKGTHTLTFTGTSGGLNHKVTASLIID